MRAKQLQSSQFLGNKMNPYQFQLDRELCDEMEAEFKKLEPESKTDLEFSLPAMAFLWKSLLQYHHDFLNTGERSQSQTKIAFCLDRSIDIILQNASTVNHRVVDQILKMIALWPEARLRHKGLRFVYLALKQISSSSKNWLRSGLTNLHEQFQSEGNSDLWSELYLCLCQLHVYTLVEARETFDRYYRHYQNHRDGIFFHASVIEHAKQDPQIIKVVDRLFQQYRVYPSPYVRIRYFEYLLNEVTPSSSWFAYMAGLEQERDHAVLAAAINHSLPFVLNPVFVQSQRHVVVCYFTFLAKQHEPPVCKAWLRALELQYIKAIQADEANLEALRTVEDTISQLLTSTATHSNVQIQQWSLRLRLWNKIIKEKQLASQIRLFQAELQSSRPNWSWQIPRELNADLFWGAVSLISADQMPLDIKKHSDGYQVFRDLRFRFSCWRLLYEMKHPSGIKRQTKVHWQSRQFRGSVRVPPHRYCELIETNIPGEPLYIPDEDSWRPWLPLPCDAYRLIWHSVPYLNIYSSYGRTEIRRPKGLIKRLVCWTKFLCRYDKIAQLRNWQAKAAFSTDAYFSELENLGFAITFSPFLADIDPVQRRSIERFIPSRSSAQKSLIQQEQQRC